MKQRRQVAERENLEAVRQRFEKWRRERKRGTKIPQRLWQAAVGLSDRHSVGEIATVLGLHYGRLKKRVSAFNGESEPQAVAGMEFVSVGAMPMEQTNVVELEDGSGKRLKVHLMGAGTGTVIEVAKALWEQVG
jgi:hypothetical protein|tara:strand:- start:1220 stop:1621 length:402 start_codon:yes stop_codon:yes gene_type:complete